MGKTLRLARLPVHKLLLNEKFWLVEFNFCCFSYFFVDVMWGRIFTPREFSEFESNLGDQQLVEVVRPWVGKTPQEIAPGSIPLGSLRNKTYVPVEVLKEEPEPLLPIEISIRIKMNLLIRHTRKHCRKKCLSQIQHPKNG